jgi:hypothetical protein
MSSRQVDLAAWQCLQTEEQVMRLEALLGSDAPREHKDRGLKTLAYLNSPECRRYIAKRNKRALAKKEE